MRIALDSSVLIAAHISRAGVCSELLEDVLLHHDLVISDFILLDLNRTLIGKFKFPKGEAGRLVSFLRRVSIVIEPAALPMDACRDPNDIPVLGTAVRGACSLLVSVDRDLLDLKAFAEILIIPPGDYWRLTRRLG